MPTSTDGTASTGGRVVFVHGPVAAGKLTVARALHALTGYPVFHNHLVVDLLTTVFPFGSAEFVRLRERFWLDVLGSAVAGGRSLIFTFAPERTVPAGFADRVARVVGDAGGQVCFVGLTASAAAQEARIADPGRRSHGKLADLAVLRQLRADGAFDVDQPPTDLEIDTTAHDPAGAAELIAAHWRLGGLSDRPG